MDSEVAFWNGFTWNLKVGFCRVLHSCKVPYSSRFLHSCKVLHSCRFLQSCKSLQSGKCQVRVYIHLGFFTHVRVYTHLGCFTHVRFYTHLGFYTHVGFCTHLRFYTHVGFYSLGDLVAFNVRNAFNIWLNTKPHWISFCYGHDGGSISEWREHQGLVLIPPVHSGLLYIPVSGTEETDLFQGDFYSSS